ISRTERCDELFGLWSALRDRPQAEHKTLRLRGPNRMVVPSRPDVVFVESRHPYDEDIGDAAVVVTGSRRDAAGTAVLLGFHRGVPALVPAQNDALASIIAASDGGRTYTNTEEFIRNVNALIRGGEPAGRRGAAWLRSTRAKRPRRLLVETVLGAAA